MNVSQILELYQLMSGKFGLVQFSFN